VLLVASLLVTLLALAVTPSPAAAARDVARHGIDSDACGARLTPCRSITRAIDHASQAGR
jgi:hypothetical protein